MTTPLLSAILVNYNAGLELGVALQSIADEMGGRPWEGVVVDNASHDGSGSVVSRFQPDVRLLRNVQNVGFARGVNQGLAASSAPVVLIMNPDCRLELGALDALQAELDRFPSCAIVGPRILNPDGSVQGSARGDPDMFTGLFGRTTMLRRVLPDIALSRRNVVADIAVADAEGSLQVDWQAERITITCTGERAVLRPEAQAALTMDGDGAGAEAKLAPAFLAAALARRVGAAITCEVDAERVRIVCPIAPG